MRLKLLPLAGALLLCAASASAITSSNDPIRTPLLGTTVSVSTSAWTKVPTTSTSGTTLILFSNPASNSSSIAVCPSASSVIPGEATTVLNMELQPGEYDWFHFYGSLNFWAISLNGASGAENLHIKEFKQ